MKDEMFENEVELTAEIEVDAELEAMNELSRRGEELEAMNELIHEDIEEPAHSDEESDEVVYGIDEDGEVIVPDDDAEEILDEVGEGLLAEDEIDEIIIGAWLFAYADLHSGEILRRKVCNYALESVMTAGRALSAYSYDTGIKADLIVKHKHALCGDLIKCRRLADGNTGVIHKSRGLHKKNSRTAEIYLADGGMEFNAIDLRAALLGNVIYGKKACVVTGLFILLADISEACNNKGHG